MSTSESRGIDTRSTRSRSAEMWTRIVVSERWPSTLSVVIPAWPSRVSEPITRMLTGTPLFGSVGSGVGSSGRSPRRCSTSADVMLFWSRL